MEFFDDPSSNQCRCSDVFGLGDVLDCLRLGWTQSNRYFGRGSTGEHGFDDFFKLVREIREVMAVPKPREFVD